MVKGAGVSWVQDWMKRAAPLHRKEAEELVQDIQALRERAANLRERVAPALKPALKASVGHLHWAEKALRDWLLRNPG